MHSVDEVHSVGADVRGAVLEVVVSRMKTLGTSTRFVAVSATVPNIHDVAEWLGASPSSREPGSRPHSVSTGTGAVGEADHQPAKVFQFDDEFRPCKLQKCVVRCVSLSSVLTASSPNPGLSSATRGMGTNSPSPTRSTSSCLSSSGSTRRASRCVSSLCITQARSTAHPSSARSVLIFCNTRKGCLQAAEALAKEYKQALAWASSRARLAWPKPPRSEYKTSDKHLAALLENGIATHHAGMDSNDRRLVERLFVDGSISIVCACLWALHVAKAKRR